MIPACLRRTLAPARGVLLLGIFLSACVSHAPIPEASSPPLPSESGLVDRVNEGLPPDPKKWVGQGKLPWGLAIRWPTAEPFLTEYFGWRKKGRRKERLHDGADLKAVKNAPIFAAGKGEVIYASRKIRSYGKMVVVDHGNAWSTVYAHLNDFKVKVGDHVEMGDLIGLAGKTGRASGPHLHFEIRLKSDPLDPLLFLPQIPSNKRK